MEIKLNLGCGRDIRKGYINIDKIKICEGVDEVINFNEFPYPYKNNSIDEILAFGLIEHLKDYEKSFKEFTRILKPSGFLHIKVPHFTCAGSNSEFHKTRFWFHSFNSYRIRKKCRTSGEASDLYNPFIQIKKKINFVKGWLFWNYLIEPIINFHPFVSVLYEHTFLCYLFPASEVEVILKKK